MPPKLKSYLFIFLALELLLSYAPAFAQSTYSGVQSGITTYLCTPPANNASNDSALFTCINKLYKFAIVVATTLGVLFIAIAGYVYMNAGGNQESVDKAKNIFVSVITAIVILMVGYVLLRGVNPDLVQFQSIQPPNVNLPAMPGGSGLEVSTPLVSSGAGPCSYQTADEASSHMQTISVSVWDVSGSGKVSNASSLTINQNVADKVKAVFQAIYNNSDQFPIHSLGGFNFRVVAGTQILSAHACGIAIDVNPTENEQIINGAVTSGQFYKPCPGQGCSPYSVTPSVVQTFNSQGFGWGGNFKSSKDYMHFSCAPNEGGNCPYF